MSKLYECKISRFFICLCLIICIVSASFCISVDKADALVINPWTIALCGSLLVAAGLSFNTAQQMESAVSSFAGSCDASLWDSLVSKAESFKDEYGTGFHFPITEAIVSAISGWLSGVTAAEGGSVSLGDVYTLNSCSVPYASSAVYDSLLSNPQSAISYGLNLDSSLDKSVCYKVTSTPIDYYLAYVPSLSSWVATSYLNAKNSSGRLAYDYDVLSVFTTHNRANQMMLVFVNSSGVNGLINVVPGSLSIPFSDVWAPGSSDAEKELVAGTDVVVPGGIINTDGVLDSDVVVGMSASNVRANSGTNTDADVVAGTGTISGTGSGTGIFEGVGAFDLVFGIPILGDILKAILTGFDLLAGLISSVFSSPIEWLKELLTSIWNAITSGFEAVLNWGSSLFDSISQFFKDCLQFLKDILASLADFLTGIVAFIPDILAWLASYTLFGDLLNKFLPQPVAVVFISFFLASIAIWLFRMIANR